MKKSRRLLLFPLLLVVLLGAAACGGGGGDSAAEGEIETVIEAAATSTDPANCGKYSTLQFMEQTTGAKGAKAEKSCEEDAGEPGQPESVSVTNIEIDGSSATADAAFEGGNFGGQALSVALVEEEGNWKLDEFKGFAEFDAKKLTETLVKQFEEEGSIEPKVISCIAEGLEKLDESEYEKLVVEQETQPIVEIAEGCE
ncbi:MAG TPA: hypothetical protein VMT37_09500 [Solirubrobacterales bacterium]|nr:hypothetical protein [Solirubrobacterales bacterium]